jgi:hypothetical protein
MRFQVGKFVCELSRDNTGKVLTTWFRRTEPPKYLNRDERAQYCTARAAFLERLGERDRPSTNAQEPCRHVARRDGA